MESMTQAVSDSPETLREVAAPQQFPPPLPPGTNFNFPPLELETRPTVNTAAAAFYLRKAEQTLRIYACRECGPLRPIRVGAHLHWRTDDIRKLLGVSA